jgi:hypothetical protein
MAVLPVVRLFFPCDEAALDLADMKWSLKNPWHTVQMPAGVTEKFGQRELWLHAQLTGGLGEFNLTVELRESDSGVRIGRPSPPERFEFVGGQLAAVEVVFHMVNVPFPTPGHYTFKLLANRAELEGGLSELRVLPGSRQ